MIYVTEYGKKMMGHHIIFFRYDLIFIPLSCKISISITIITIITITKKICGNYVSQIYKNIE